MRKFSTNVFLLFTFLFLFDSQPTDLIWINQGSLQLRQYDKTSMIITLPCQNKQQPCQFSYKSIPLGWFALSNGDLLLPRNQTIKDQTFYIQVIISEPEGQSIEVNLMIEYKNQQMTLLLIQQNEDLNDQIVRDPFENINPTQQIIMNQENTQIQPNLMNTAQTLQLSLIQQVKQLISQNRTLQLTIKLSQTINQVKNCKQKIAELKQIDNLLQNALVSNQAELSLIEGQLNKLEKRIEELQNQKQYLISRSNPQEFNNKMIQLQNLKQEAKMQVTKYQNIANNYLIAIKRNSQSSQDVQNTTQQYVEVSYEMQEQQLDGINMALEELFSRRSQLQQQISQKKVQITIKNLEYDQQGLKFFEDKYKQHSQLAVIAKIEAEDAAYRLINYQNKVKNYQQRLQQINDIIAQKTQLIESMTVLENGQSVKQVMNLVSILRENYNKLNEELNKLRSRCHRPFY